MARSAPSWPDVIGEIAGEAHRSLSTRVHDVLFKAILRGKIPPGSHLTEQPIADALGVSRISVREAIRELTREGLVQIYPNRGAYTAEFSPNDVEEVFSLRAALEKLAVRLAAKQASRTDLARLEDMLDDMVEVEGAHDRLAGAGVDTAFHLVLMEISGHERALGAWRTMSAQITMVVYNTSTYYPDIEGLADRHHGIVDILRRRDPDGAEAWIADHILEGGRGLLEAIGRDRLLDERSTSANH